ncbi:hypothetical protein WMY93_001820 [Mugilogobius chulae]|uniref:deoxyribonuclease II n=1 Tax=Mugilogobius chulae TaxID=88201 RepID=A0AAW0PV81_9GOBI
MHIVQNSHTYSPTPPSAHPHTSTLPQISGPHISSVLLLETSPSTGGGPESAEQISETEPPSTDASFGFLSYNDQPPGCSSPDYGHSKGVVMGCKAGNSNEGTAVWMVHSTPQFPFIKDETYFWPNSGELNGQIFMCVSLHYRDLKTVGNHLQNIRALVFDHSIPDNFYDALKNAVQKTTFETRDNGQQGKVRPLKTRGGKDLKIFAKRNTKNRRGEHNTVIDECDNEPNQAALPFPQCGDLYLQLAQKFSSRIQAQTYNGSKGRDRSYCTEDLVVVNINKIKIDTLGQWNFTKDHSKWAVTTKPGIEWTCIGDSNRSPSQYARPGGALCINNRDVNNRFTRFVDEAEECTWSFR